MLQIIKDNEILYELVTINNSENNTIKLMNFGTAKFKDKIFQNKVEAYKYINKELNKIFK